jgi:hypothetical protein
LTDTGIQSSPLLGSQALSSLSTGLITSYTLYSKKVMKRIRQLTLCVLAPPNTNGGVIPLGKTGESEHE